MQRFKSYRHIRSSKRIHKILLLFIRSSSIICNIKKKRLAQKNFYFIKFNINLVVKNIYRYSILIKLNWKNLSNYKKFFYEYG